ncbi:MAG: hypothetical protein NVSMB46_08350 [Candidatus Saccharimonadales bacterium]
MHYFEVFVSSNRFHGSTALTYEYPVDIERGQVVTVPMQNQRILGLISRPVQKPSFPTKSIIAVITAVPVPTTHFELLEWLQNYYPAPLGTLLQLFLPSSLLQKSKSNIPPSVENHSPVDLPSLTTEQKNAMEVIQTAPRQSVLIHGNTGSGKTRLYQECAKKVLLEGRSVLVLTPEIGLTPQLIESFERAFPGRTITIHSHLTPAQKRTVWLRILQSPVPLIIIGPRSALFTPLQSIGLIVVDECHDNAYKQEQMPYYEAAKVAGKLAAIHKAQLLLGSATPLVADYYIFQTKKLPIVRMTQQAANDTASTPTVEIVDLRDRTQFSRSQWLSTKMLDGIQRSIDEQQQSLIFLNRRGTARLVICQECDWQALCPNCDLPLTYHADIHRLQCHNCSYHSKAPTMCPHCQSIKILFKSIGTKSIVSELQRYFPKAIIRRFDSDTIKADSLEHGYHDINDGKIDILVGTQVLSKGLDLEKLTFVGIVIADTSLYFPDYTAEERSFQMLTQVMGRVGRGHSYGHIVLQSYHPDSRTLELAIQKNYLDFYQQQIAERKKYTYPPFCFILKLQCARSTSKAAESASLKLLGEIQRKNLPIELIGPTAAFTEKSNNKFYWQIIIKARNRSILTTLIPSLPSQWNYDIDPLHLL